MQITDRVSHILRFILQFFFSAQSNLRTAEESRESASKSAEAAESRIKAEAEAAGKRERVRRRIGK